MIFLGNKKDIHNTVQKLKTKISDDDIFNRIIIETDVNKIVNYIKELKLFDRVNRNVVNTFKKNYIITQS